MRIITFATPEERALGLQHKAFIEDETLFVFPDIDGGHVFHSRNVPEPFDIAFLAYDGYCLRMTRMFPPDDVIEVPEEAVVALESKPGNMARWGIVQGSVVSL